MPTLPASLEHQFSSLSTAEQSEKDVVGVVVTPTNSISVSPDQSFDDNSSTEASSTGGADASDDSRMLVARTEHKILELQGMMDDEPLLMKNPHRFVIFPIQDNDVSELPVVDFCVQENLMPTLQNNELT
jgi:hypothetical protein